MVESALENENEVSQYGGSMSKILHIISGCVKRVMQAVTVH